MVLGVTLLLYYCTECNGGVVAYSIVCAVPYRVVSCRIVPYRVGGVKRQSSIMLLCRCFTMLVGCTSEQFAVSRFHSIPVARQPGT